MADDSYYLKHDDIEEMAITVDSDGNAYAISRNIPIGDQIPLTVFGPRLAPPVEFFRLLATAPMLYQCLTQQMTMLEMLLRDTPDTPRTHHVRKMMDSMRQLTKMTQSCAIDGFGCPEKQPDSDNRDSN